MRPPLSAACTDLAPLEAILARHAGSEGALLPVLQDVQRVFGFVPSAAVPRIAGALNLSRAEIHGVLDFYEELRTGPTGRVRVQICRAEACRALGAGALEGRGRRAARPGLRRDDRRRQRHAASGLLPGQLRLRPLGAHR